MPAHNAQSIAELVNGTLEGPAELRIEGVNSLDEAGPADLTFITSAKFARKWAQTRAGAALVRRGIKVADHDAATRALITVDDPELAMIAVLNAFAPPHTMPDLGVHPTAFVHESAKLGKDVRIGAHVSVGREAELGDGVILHAGVRIYSFVKIGAGTEIHGNTVVRERCTIGKESILHQNVSIGADGFGYRPAPDGKGLIKVPHIGTVRIGDSVEIGAGACIDRGKFGATTVGDGSKIDNLVQVAHNCQIGRCVIIAGCVGISGSVTIGDGAQIGGGVGIRDHLTIGAGAKVGAMAGVMRDVPAGETHLGMPAEEASKALRLVAATRRIAGLAGSDKSDRRTGDQ